MCRTASCGKLKRRRKRDGHDVETVANVANAANAANAANVVNVVNVVTVVTELIVIEQTAVTEGADMTTMTKRSGRIGAARTNRNQGGVKHGLLGPTENRRMVRVTGKGKAWSGTCELESQKASRIVRLVTSASSTHS